MSGEFISFEVREVVKESAIINSYYLAPQTPLTREYVPGEYLVFEYFDENEEVIRREYSISGKRGDEIRVTIKRETAPQCDLPSGVMSTRFHDQIKPGDIVKAGGPLGAFKLDRASTRPVVLLSGGVGLTPVVAMAHDLAKTSRDTYFIHACEDGRVHALGDEIRQLASRYDNIRTHFLYRRPTTDDVKGRDYDTQGMISRSLIEQLIPSADCDFYLCGPSPFMTAVYEMLLDIGVVPERIAYEFFGPATVLNPKKAVSKDTIVETSDAPKVTFVKSGEEFIWDASEENLLEFAEENGIMVDFSCRAGSCDTCKTKVLKGSVNYPVEPFERPEEGYALLCCCVPDSDLELDV